MFEWLETSAVAIWVGESLWGYPIMLGLHAVGLAIVVGIFVMLDLRLLGVIRGVSFDAFLGLYRLAWIGLVINAGHGLNYDNVGEVAATPQIVELNIGHAIVSRAVFDGMAVAVSEMKRLMTEARGG